MRGVLAAAAAALVLAVPAAALPAPGGPGLAQTWPSAARGLVTSTTLGSRVWATLTDGGLGAISWPRVDRPRVARLELVVGDGASFAERVGEATTERVELIDPEALEYRQVETARSGRYRITQTAVTDPVRDAVLVQVRLESLDGGAYRAYAYLDPASGSGASSGDGLLATGTRAATALVCSCRFTRVTSGFAGSASDPWPDLRADGRLDATFAQASGGNVVQLGDTGGAPVFTLALGFGETAFAALTVARASLAAGFDDAALAYETTWRDYLRSLPRSGLSGRLLERYRVALMTLRALEDKTARGSTVNRPGYGAVVRPDVLYEVGSALLSAGDRAAAGRALARLLRLRQRSTRERALQLVLAWRLGRTDARAWRALRPEADAVARSPRTRAPAPAAAAIAGLVCAAELARLHGDAARARRYLHEADARQRHVAVPRREPAVLELVRLGVLPARDPRVRSALGHARLTPAARGEYAVAAGLPARRWLAASAPAEGDLDAVRLARFVRLARDVRARRLLDRPAVVAGRYARPRP